MIEQAEQLGALAVAEPREGLGFAYAAAREDALGPGWADPWHGE